MNFFNGIFTSTPGSCGALDKSCNPNASGNLLAIGGVVILVGWLLFGGKR